MWYWLTFNEINAGTMPIGAALSLGTVRGYSGPIAEVPDRQQERFQALHHQLVASAEAVRLLYLEKDRLPTEKEQLNAYR